MNNDWWLYKDSLMHHGVKGQKWGVRNGPPYPLTEKTSKIKKISTNKSLAEKRKRGLQMKSDLIWTFLHEDVSPNSLATPYPKDDEDLHMKKGEKIYHVTPGNFESIRDGQDLYISATDIDRHLYRAYLTLMLRYKGYGSKSPIKEVEITLKEDLNAPSNIDQQRIFDDVYKSNKSLVDGELNNYYQHHKDRPGDTYDAFIKSLDEQTKSKDIFYSEMKKNGYNAVLDQHDIDSSWMGAYKPLIVMNASDTFGDFKSKDVKDDDIRSSIKRLSGYKK